MPYLSTYKYRNVLKIESGNFPRGDVTCTSLLDTTGIAKLSVASCHIYIESFLPVRNGVSPRFCSTVRWIKIIDVVEGLYWIRD
jgi:hypothetical protein